MDPLSIAALVASGIKGISGLVQGIGGAQKQRNLWNSRPILGTTEGEKSNDSLFRNLAASTELPGQQSFEDKLGQTYSQGVSDINKTAISSLGATQGAIDLSGKKMQAVQDLAGSFAEYKQKNTERLGAWNNQKSQNEMQRFQTNSYDPWQMQYGQAVGQKQAGFGNMGSGIDSGIGALGDYAGTKAMMDMLAKIGK